MTSTPVLRGASPTSLGGPCALCGADHHLALETGPAIVALEAWFLALTAPATAADRALLGLLERAGGRKMLATLVGRAGDGSPVVLRAFSGDLAGHGDVDGCVPSIIRREDTAALEAETLQIVARATARLASCDAAVRDEARRTRKAASGALMAAMIDATRLRTRGGRRVPLRAAFFGAAAGRGIPSGTADCALPKLLDAAFARGLEIVSVAEASWAPTPADTIVDDDRAHGVLAAPCAIRCTPILPAMLCPLPGPSS